VAWGNRVSFLKWSGRNSSIGRQRTALHIANVQSDGLPMELYADLPNAPKTAESARTRRF
jgi:hypothetical protein